MKMPEKDPSLWAAMLAWLAAHQTSISAGLTAAGVAVCRVIYGGGGRRKMLSEGVICGLIGMNVAPPLEYFSMPTNLASFVACMVGFLGVERIRDWWDKRSGRSSCDRE